MRKRRRQQIDRSRSTPFLGMGVVLASVLFFLAILYMTVVLVRTIAGWSL